MVFSSVEFLFLFLPVALFFTLCVPLRAKNLAILFASIVFYAFGGLFHLPLMLGVILFDYFFAILIARAKKCRKVLLAFAVAANILTLFFFKYFDTLLAFLGMSRLGLALPIGISFYIFQALSYVIDVWRGDLPPEKNPVTFFAYVTLFPQLIAGPIVKYQDVSRELAAPARPSADAIASGIRRFVCGLAKKVLIANTASAMWDTISALSPDDRTVILARLGLIFYSLFIYFDFSGYSDMAIGLGKILGFDFPENFNYPYISHSLTEFWRRWHITLSSWFREYLYIPLGGNRRGRARTYFNLFCVWLFTGLWHGATVNFAIWGLYYFVLLVAEKTFLSKFLEKLPRFVSHGYALFFISLGWLIFAFDEPASGLAYLKTMFSFNTFALGDLYEILRHLPFLCVAFFAATPLPKKLFYRFSRKKLLASALSVGAFALSVVYLVSSSYNPFLYFRF
ncbi:MAG: MBOAT family protein [Ruminococcaceae bacterium]|nr:MBOAT family protein [Oscillospiraceae bacterium]